MLSVLEVTQRVPPTCIIKTDFTYHHGRHSPNPAGKRQRQPAAVVAPDTSEQHSFLGVLRDVFHQTTLHFVQHTPVLPPENQSHRKKGLVLIILVIVFPHAIKIKQDMFV